MQLEQMMTALSSVWENASEEVLPFICRKKASEVKISVIIPVFNVERFLTKALQSIVHQTLEDIEIICIDDGSTDHSPEILDFFAAHDERFTVIHQANSNGGAARNRGLDIATGKYLYFMDSDDWCVPHMLERAFNLAEEKDCDTVVWAFLAKDDNTKKTLWKLDLTNGLADFETDNNLFISLSPCVWNKIFRADMIRNNKVRFQEITNNNDSAFSMCALALSRRIWKISNKMYFYRKSGIGLQATLNKDPYCCIQSRIHSQNEMNRLGLMTPPYQRHFINAFYNVVSNQLKKIPLSFEQLIEVKSIINKYFDYCEITADQICEKEAYFFIQSMFFNNNEYYPTKLYAFLLQTKKESAKAKKATKSFSYRLGRALTWFPRKVRGGMLRLQDHGFGYTSKRLLQKIKRVFAK